MLALLPPVLFGISSGLACVVGLLMTHRFAMYSKSITVTIVSVTIYTVGAGILLLGLYAMLFI